MNCQLLGCDKPKASNHNRTKYCVDHSSQKPYLAKMRKRENELGPPDRCNICGHKLAARGVMQRLSPHWDHNHGTGEGRGWLCKGCNAGIGALGDNPRLLRAAAAYLEERGCTISRPRFS